MKNKQRINSKGTRAKSNPAKVRRALKHQKLVLGQANPNPAKAGRVNPKTSQSNVRVKKKTKMKTEWNFKKLFYTSPRDPQIEKDVQTMKRALTAFEKKYKNKTDYLKSDTKLLAALKDYTKLYKKAFDGGPLYYLGLLTSVESGNVQAQAKLNKLSQELTTYINKILFFTLKLGKINKAQQKKFVQSPKLVAYKHFLEVLFKNARFELSEKEEQLRNKLVQTSRSLWLEGVEKAISKQSVWLGKEEVPVNGVMSKLPTLPTTQRRKLFKDAVITLRDNVGDFAESEMNAVLAFRQTMDDVRGHAHPYSERILTNENDEKSVLNMAHMVTEHFTLSKRFHTLKKRIMGVDRLEYADRLASIGKIKRNFSFRETLKLTQKAFNDVDPKFKDILDSYIKRGQIDVYPKKGKRGGAFCASQYGSPTMVLLNHDNGFNSVRDLAHEMGHAIHADVSKGQLPMECHAQICTAEVASTFFENTVFDALFETLREKEKVIALHDSINDKMATVFRQIAFFNFELELHMTFREKGFVAKEEMAALLNKHMKAYLGPAVTMQEHDGYFFIYVGHFRSYFYVYAYAYGELISQAMYDRYKEDPSYIKQVLYFLKAGSSDTPENIFKSIGIDTTKSGFWKEGLMSIDRDITKLEKLTKKNK